MPLSASTPAFGKGTERSATYYKKLFALIGTTAEPGDEARRVLAWLSARKIKLDGEGFAPETEAGSWRTRMRAMDLRHP